MEQIIKSVSNKTVKHIIHSFLYMVGNGRYTRILYIYQISKFMFEMLIRKIIFFCEVSLGLYRIYCLPFVKSIIVWTISNYYL